MHVRVADFIISLNNTIYLRIEKARGAFEDHAMKYEKVRKEEFPSKNARNCRILGWGWNSLNDSNVDRYALCRLISLPFFSKEPETCIPDKQVKRWTDAEYSVLQFSNRFGLVPSFNGIPTFVGYLMPKPSL